jgi:peptide/nickel transport system substrate-binding protein/oligopeptide transport system substrate-binding protein
MVVEQVQSPGGNLMNILKRLFAVPILAIFIFCPAPLCCGEDEDSLESRDYAESRPRSRERDELTVSFSSDDLELDFRKSYMASEAQIFTAIYEGLFSYNPLTMEPIPAAASRWEISEDKKQWTFTIKDNAKFHSGDPLRAGDFKAAWLSLLDSGRDSPYSSLFDIIE